MTLAPVYQKPPVAEPSDSLWLNEYGITLTSNVDFLYYDPSSDALHARLIKPVFVYGTGEWDGTLLPSGTSLSDVQTAAAEFVTAAGPSWVVIGDVTSPITGQVTIAAINLRAVFSIQAASDGLIVDGDGAADSYGPPRTSGFAPYADGPSAVAAILAMAGSYSFTS